MKIMIIQVAQAGEVVFTTPLIRALKVQGEADVFVLTSKEGFTALQENPYVSEVLLYEHRFGSILRLVKRLKPDHIIHLNGTWLTRFVSTVAPASVAWYKAPYKGSITSNRKRKAVLSSPSQHIVEQYMDLASGFGVRNDELTLDYFISYKDEVPLDWLSFDFQKKYVVLMLEAPYETRRLPLQRLIELCDKINKPIILLGSEADAEHGEKIEQFFQRSSVSQPWEEGLKELNKKTIIYNGCGKFSFHQKASLIRQSSYVFTFDNDFIAIASAFSKETFTLWGNTVLAFGRYPYNTRFTVLENNKLPCRPCSTKGYGVCPLQHFKCMNDVVFDFYLY